MAINTSNKILKISPNHPSALFIQAVAHSKNNNTKASLTLFNKLIKLYPTNADVHYNFGLMLENHGKSDEALIAYENSIKYNKNNPFVYNNLGNIHYLKANLSKAIQLYSHAIQLQPTNIGFIKNLNKSLFENKDFSNCIVSINTLIKLTTLDIDDISFYINSHIQIGNYRQALTQSLIYLKEDPGHYLLNYLVGLSALKMSRYPVAIKYFKRSLKLNDTNIDGYMNLAISYS